MSNDHYYKYIIMLFYEFVFYTTFGLHRSNLVNRFLWAFYKILFYTDEVETVE